MQLDPLMLAVSQQVNPCLVSQSTLSCLIHLLLIGLDAGKSKIGAAEKQKKEEDRFNKEWTKRNKQAATDSKEKRDENVARAAAQALDEEQKKQVQSRKQPTKRFKT